MMKQKQIFAWLIVPVFLAAMPDCSFGDVKIFLKNEGSIIADECREESDRFVCFKMGGTFEVDKEDILSVKGIAPGQEFVPLIVRPETESAEKSEQTGKPGATQKNNATPGAGNMQDPGKAADAADPVMQQRELLQKERESLLKERQQIQSDIKNAPDWMPTKQWDELNRRNVDLDARIKKFNDDAKKIQTETKNPGDDTKK